MQLNENYSIKYDAANTILCYEAYGELNPKTGKPIKSSEESYHPNLEAALKRFLLKSVDGHENAIQILQAINQAKTDIEKALKK